MANETIRQFYNRNALNIVVEGLDGANLSKVLDITQSWTDGTGDNQITQVWADFDRSLGATTETHDLDGLPDFQGGTTSGVTKLKFLYIKNKSTGTLKIGGGDFTSLFADSTDKLLVPAGSDVMIRNPTTGYTITASTGDGLLIEFTVAGTYDIVLGFA